MKWNCELCSYIKQFRKPTEFLFDIYIFNRISFESELTIPRDYEYSVVVITQDGYEIPLMYFNLKSRTKEEKDNRTGFLGPHMRAVIPDLLLKGYINKYFEFPIDEILDALNKEFNKNKLISLKETL